MTYFTSDQHFGHFNIIGLCQRPFATAEEMDAALLARWNAKVGEDDEVYIVGDLFFRAATVEPILKTLHGRKHLVVGNHDIRGCGAFKSETISRASKRSRRSLSTGAS